MAEVRDGTSFTDSSLSPSSESYRPLKIRNSISSKMSPRWILNRTSLCRIWNWYLHIVSNILTYTLVHHIRLCATSLTILVSNSSESLALPVGLEPTTLWLTATCSTCWAIGEYVYPTWIAQEHLTMSSFYGLELVKFQAHQAWWTFRDSNPGPIGYEPRALTNWAKGPDHQIIVLDLSQCIRYNTWDTEDFYTSGWYRIQFKA